MDGSASTQAMVQDKWRELYRLALSPEYFFDERYLHGLLGHCEKDELSALAQQIDDWQVQQAAAYSAAASAAVNQGNAKAFAQAVAIFSSPMAAVLGCWLQGMSAPGVFEDPAQLKLMQLFAHDMGVGYPQASRAHHFRALLGQLQLTAYALASRQLATLPDLSDDAFELPAMLLALSRRSDEFGDVLCGIDWALRAVGLCPGWAALGQLDGLSLDVRRLDLSESFVEQEAVSLRQISQWVSRQVAAQGEARQAQLLRGANWVFAALKRWNAQLYNASLSASSPQQAMAQLMQRLARAGAVYHQSYLVEGRSLAQWLKDAQSDPLPLLDVLSRSRLIVPGFSSKSVLVTSLVAPTGRMFRIFSEAELDVIRRWIDWLPQAADSQQLPRQPVSPGATETSQVVEQSEALGAWPRSLREAYFVLQGRALGPATLRFAQAYVTRWLARSRRSLKTSVRQLPEQWGPNVLRTWLLDKHEQNGQQFDESDPTSMPSREEIVESVLQLAPLTLIDGAWLQGFTDIELASSHVGYALFQTYWDELGNGIHALNHPKIYRDGLRQMAFELAPTGSREFAEDPRLDEDSFRLPVYWLCLGKLPVTFMPEILGMNLAMELSGVGGSYRSARRFLRHYGFSTAFVDLHNTIDNVSTGHSAWAADAIDAYMRSLVAGEQIAEHWYRIRVGYESLAPMPSKWASVLRRLGLKGVANVLPRPARGEVPNRYLHHLPIALDGGGDIRRREALEDYR
ncbi:MAG: iron-containing redox enzyme family protein [Gammaproteobacteria bacterium]|nr:iron-containing redox enzyme family protein [Gammaproteobacteria bacterium]MBU1490692.1 iron-containing redox enzyme family protein [Gammaproteobacteria bacterium]MBU2064435.1 iron-containing redox enzyme family protein [Gammaproteobacteria bacterium]MBU2138241.1 iron-containing redox enzyme family protein [Gammaproteobacteria bacterium]MBU2217871.1 iron-containing redox enzyme family protein [Gammaproteobacteria bacterium]